MDPDPRVRWEVEGSHCSQYCSMAADAPQELSCSDLCDDGEFVFDQALGLAVCRP